MSAMDLNEYDSTDVRGFYSWTNTLAGVHYGPGVTETALPKLLDTIGGKRALIVTGKSLLEKSDVVTKVINILNIRNAHAGTLSSIGQHAPIAGIREGVKLFQSSGADCIVSIGGGSPVDASKAIIHQLHEEDKSKPFFRQIAIPTTLSAAEYTVGAGFTNDEGKKVSVSDPQLAPSGIILDAELTLATPERLWLSTGMRAVDHAVENLYRPLVPPPIKHLCYAALRDLFTYLPKSKAAPTDLNIRQKLQLASWMSLWPIKFEKYSAIGLSHALGHKLGAAYSIPHGITSCLTLAPVVRFKAQAAPPETKEDDREWLAGALGAVGVPSEGSPQADGVKLGDLIQKLVDDLGLTSTLTEYKVPKEDVPHIAELALGKKDTPAFEPVVRLLKSLY